MVLVSCRGGTQPFSYSTSAVGWGALVVTVLFGGVYTAWRMLCCCSRKRQEAAAQRGACDVPLHVHPLLALGASFSYARGHGGPLQPGAHTTVHVQAYELGAQGFAATPVRLRLVPSTGLGATVELDQPPPVGAFGRALSGRLHSGLFTVIGSDPSSARSFLLASADGRRLQRASSTDGTWSASFPECLLARASPQDAPLVARGFAVRLMRRCDALSFASLADARTLDSLQGRPMRRLLTGMVIEGLGGFATASIEISVASAAWQATCRAWWERVLTRGLATATLLGGFEYFFTVVVPVNVERLGRWLFVRGGLALSFVLFVFALWGFIVNAAAGRSALGSAWIVWIWALMLNHVIVWPILLLLSAGIWRDVPALPPPPPPPPPLPPSPRFASGSSKPGGSPKMTPHAAVAVEDGNPFARPSGAW